MKVISDTNIIISAAVSSDGNPAKIFELILSGVIKNFISSEIINEIKEVMERDKIKKLVSFKDRQKIIENLEKFSEKVDPKVKLDIVKEDPKDNKFLECAVTAKIDYLISGDEHLLNLKEFKGVKILSPLEFIQLFESHLDRAIL